MIYQGIIITLLMILNANLLIAQVGSSILDGMDTTYIDLLDGKTKIWKNNHYNKHIEHRYSTVELTFHEIYFVDTTLIPHQNEEIILYSVDRKKSKTYFTDSVGKIEVMLPPGIWNVYVKKLGIKKELPMFAMGWKKKTKESLVDYRDVYLYNWEETIALNILFEPGKSTIQAKSHHQLDELYEYLHRHPEIRIEIIGHTDNTGNADANLKLSKARADAIKKYLTDKGIASTRLETDGKGDTKPIADNTTEEGKANNRRTEIRELP